MNGKEGEGKGRRGRRRRIGIYPARPPGRGPGER